MSAAALWTKYRALAYAVAAEFHSRGGAPGRRAGGADRPVVAARDWKRDRGASFPTFARLVIRRRLVTVLRAALREEARAAQ